MSHPTASNNSTTADSSESNEPHIKVESGQGPFESFIAVAISTILTVLLAWRVLIESERKKPSLTDSPLNSSKSASEVRKMSHSTVSTNSYAHHGYVNPPQPVIAEQTDLITLRLNSSSTQLRNNSKSDSHENLSRLSRPIVVGLEDYQQDLSLSSDRVNLSSIPLAFDDFHTDVATPFPPVYKTGDNRATSDYLDLAISSTPSNSTTPEITASMMDPNRTSNGRTFEGYESDISASDPGIPQYLDTITEEDTDDLTTTSSSSSGDSDLRSKTLSDKLRDIRARLKTSIESVNSSSSEISPKSLSVLNRPLLVGMPLSSAPETPTKSVDYKIEAKVKGGIKSAENLPIIEETVDSPMADVGKSLKATNDRLSCLLPLETLTDSTSQLLAEGYQVEVGSISNEPNNVANSNGATRVLNVNFSSPHLKKPSGPYWDSDDTLSGAESEFDDDLKSPDRPLYPRYQQSNSTESEPSLMEVNLAKQLELKRSYMLTYTDGFPSGMEEFDSDDLSKRISVSSDSSFLRLEAALERDENANLTVLEVMETAKIASSNLPPGNYELSGHEGAVTINMSKSRMLADDKQPPIGSVDSALLDVNNAVLLSTSSSSSSGEWSTSSSEETLTGAKNFAGSQETCIAREGSGDYLINSTSNGGDQSEVLTNPYTFEGELLRAESTNLSQPDCITFLRQSCEPKAVCSVCLQSHCIGHSQQVFPKEVLLLANNTDLGLTPTTTTSATEELDKRDFSDLQTHLKPSNLAYHNQPTLRTANSIGIEVETEVSAIIDVSSPPKNNSPANNLRQTYQQGTAVVESFDYRNSSFEGSDDRFCRSTVVTPVSTATSPVYSTSTPTHVAVVDSNSPVIVASAVSKAISKDTAEGKVLGSATANAVSRNPYVALARATATAASQAVSNYQANNNNQKDSEVALVASAAVSFNPNDIKPELPAVMSQQRFADRFEQSLHGRTGSSGLDRNANRIPQNPVNFSSQTQSATTWSTPANQTKTTGIPWGTASIITPGTRIESGLISPTDSNYSSQRISSMDTPKYPIRVTVKEEKIEVKRSFPPQYLSSDHLQKLLKEPYFRQEKPQVKPATTPVPNDPKPAAVPLSERNLQFWSSLPENTVNNQQNLQRWRNSMNLEDEISLNGSANGDINSPVEPAVPKIQPITKPILKRDNTDEFVESYKTKWSQPELDEETQSQLAKLRKNKYKAKIDRAKREFLDSKASVSDLYKTPEEFERKFKVPIDSVMRKPPVLRGPLLAKFHSPKFKSSIDVSDIKVNLKAPEPLWDDEYNNIVQKAESVWAAYKKRVTPPKESLFSRHKAFSTGYLETNVDTGEDSAVVRRPVELEVTNMDEVHRSIHSVGPGSQPTLDHHSRSRTKSTGQLKSETPKDPYSRARSMDYIMDKRAREELEPPENELRKILGGDESHLSEHELRFKKSVEKLHTPDWYFYSDPNKKQAELDRRSVKSATSGWRTSPESSYPNSPEPPETPGFLRQQRPASQPRNFQPFIPAPVQPSPTTTQSQNRVAPEPKPRVALPTNFFDRYKEEIEELRKSRSALHTTTDSDDSRRVSSTGVSVPVATVRPQLQSTTTTIYEHNASFFSDTTITSVTTTTQPQVAHPRDPLPGAIRVLPASQQAQNRLADSSAPLAFDEDFGSNALRTSTPYSSEKLARKTAPPVEAVRNSSPRPMKPPPVPPKSQHQIPVAPEERPRPNDLLLPPTKIYAGWTVAAPTAMDLDAPRNRNSRVIEVADTFFESDNTAGGIGADGVRHVTLEEILDSLLGLNSKGTGADHLRVLEDKSGSTLELNTPTPPSNPSGASYTSGPLNPVFVQDSALMQKCAKNPQIADKLLKSERLWVRCQCCGKVREKQHAQLRFVTCKNCYTYYCCRSCRRTDWIYHRDTCNFARINTLCKEVIMQVRIDTDSQYQMSRVARQGYNTRGRGSVNFRFRSPQLAETFVQGGWASLQKYPGNFLYFFTVQDLTDGGKDRNLIAACRRYDPRTKFILSVSIIADIDDVPETPDLERSSLGDPSEISMSRSFKDSDSWYSAPGTKPPRSLLYSEPEDPLMTYNYRPIRTADSGTPVQLPAAPVLPFARTVSLPPQQRKQPKSQGNLDFDAKNLLKSVLKSMENIAPDPIDNSNLYSSDNSAFTRGPGRHTVGPTPTKRSTFQQQPNNWENNRSYHQEQRSSPVVLSLHGAIADVAESEV